MLEDADGVVEERSRSIVEYNIWVLALVYTRRGGYADDDPHAPHGQRGSRNNTEQEQHAGQWSYTLVDGPFQANNFAVSMDHHDELNTVMAGVHVHVHAGLRYCDGC